MAPPVQPFFGSVLLTGVAPANCDIAATAPAMFCWSNAPNAPLHSDMIATLIGVPDASLRGSTAGCGSGHVIVDGASATAVSAGADELSPPPPLLSSLSSLPQPAAARAATPNAIGEPGPTPAHTSSTCSHPVLPPPR